MKTEIDTLRIFRFTGLLLLLFVGCQSDPVLKVNDIGTQSTPNMPIETSATVGTFKTITATVVFQPTTETESIVTSTPFSFQSLPIEKKKADVLELYNSNANCKLPCWWGFMPGETTWNTVEQFLDDYGLNRHFLVKESESDSDFVVIVYIPVPPELSENEILTQEYRVDNGKIAIIYPEQPQETSKIYSISEILNTYGPPTEVWIDTIGFSFSEYFPFRVVLFYPEKGILIKYLDDADFTNEYLIGCPQERSGKLTLWSPEMEMSFPEALNGTNALGTHGEQYYKPLEEATDMDLETFYKTYLDPNTDVCIETPAELWMDK